MKIFLDVYQDPEDQSIKIRLDCLSEDSNDHYVPNHLIKEIKEFYINADADFDPTLLKFLQLMLSQYPKSNAKQIFKCIEHLKEGAVYIEEKIELRETENPFIAQRYDGIFTKSDDKKIKHSSLVYTLPKEPLLALQLITCLCIYFEQTEDAIFLSPFSPESLYDNLLSHPAYFDNLDFLYSLFQFKNEDYEHTLKIIASLYEHYETFTSLELEDFESEPDCYSGELAECIITYHCQLLWPDLTHLLTNPDKPYYEKVQGLLSQARLMIDLGKPKELSQMIISLNTLAKKTLLESCLGMKAHDEGNYKWGYTEFELISDINTYFKLRNDGKMSLSNYQNSLSYQEYYAEGLDNHAILEAEMIHLAKCLGLEFEACDFHQEMVFTEESSQKLQALGLHFNLNYVQDLMHVQNQACFFKRHVKDIPQDALNLMARYGDEPLSDEDARVVLRF